MEIRGGKMKTPKEIADDYRNKPAGRIYPQNPRLIEKGICVVCMKKVGDFRTTTSRREYEIAGTCQECQDDIFGKGE